MNKGNYRNQKHNSKKHPTRDRSNYRVHKLQNSYDEINCAIKGFGLIISDVSGDGNCLFRSLSDQIFGTDAHHAQLRREICEYIEEHSDYFKNFFTTDNGHTFENHLRAMKKLGTHGDNFELVAFANKYNVDIHIYQNSENRVLIIHGCPLGKEHVKPAASKNRIIHLAYHDWEHYSSIRNIKGPFKGLPNIDIQRNIEELKGQASSNDSKNDSSNESEYKPNIFIDEKKLQANALKITRKTSCHDTELVKQMLRENKNNLKMVRRLINSMDRAQRKGLHNFQRQESNYVISQETTQDFIQRSAPEATYLSTQKSATHAASDDSFLQEKFSNSICLSANFPNSIEIVPCQNPKLDAISSNEFSSNSENYPGISQSQLSKSIKGSKKYHCKGQKSNASASLLYSRKSMADNISSSSVKLNYIAI